MDPKPEPRKLDEPDGEIINMKKFNYIFSAIGWLGFFITLTILVTLKKCVSDTPQITESKTIINNYYDSTEKAAPLKYEVPGPPIFIPVPTDVDTAKILALYFARFPFARVFENDTVTITLRDTISKNSFFSPGKATYKWHKPIRTVESTTVTVESPRKINFLAGGHADFNKKFFQDWGPDLYLQTKRGQQFGVGYNVNQQSVSIKAAINLNDAFRSKNK